MGIRGNPILGKIYTMKIEMIPVEEFTGQSGELYLVRVENKHQSFNYMPSKLSINIETGKYSWSIHNWIITHISKSPIE
jgi:hypothetical protein